MEGTEPPAPATSTRLLVIALGATVGVTFATETLIMLVLGNLPVYSISGQALLDSTLLSLVILPVLYVFAFRPLFTHITERERVEQALRSTEDRYRDLVENSHELICTHDLDGRILSANSAAATIMGVPQEAALRMNIADLLVTEDRPLFRAYLEEIRAYGRARGVMRVRTAGGETRFWEYDNTLRTEDVAAPVVRGMARDITEQKRAEQTLRSSAERFSALVEHGLDFISLLAADGTLLWESPAASRPLGYPPDAFVGRNIFELVHPDDVDRVRQLWAEVLREPARLRVDVCRLRRSDGRWCWVEAGATNLLHNTSVQAIVINYRDITARKLAEDTLHLQSAALNAAANAIVITDPNGQIEWVNAAFTALSGYTVDEVLGRNLRDLVRSGVQDSAFYKQVWETLLAGHVWRGEMINRRKDGSRYPEEQVITPVRDASGAITHFIAIKRDLTEEKRAALQMMQAQKMETVGRLAGGIAHDFNNLLTVINGTADFAMTRLRDDDPIRAEFAQILEAGNRAATLTRQLLAFSRKQIMKPVVLNLNTVIEDMRPMLSRLMGENITLVMALADGLGSVRVDPGQIEQVILNLAVNAKDAMPDGGTVTIETADVQFREAYTGSTHSAPPGAYVMLAVSDTGTGMDEATRAKIFEPFFTTKEQGKGTGLGLSTVDGIVRQSGGSVRVYSEPGKGTTFKIYLPRVADAAFVSSSAPAAATARGSETILLVEDEEALRRLTARMLRSAGYMVLVAGSGEDALLMLKGQGQPVDLLFTDVVLPGMGGRELATRIAADHPEIRILFTSGYSDDMKLRLSVRDQSTHFVAKPYGVTDVTRKVREALDGRP